MSENEKPARMRGQRRHYTEAEVPVNTAAQLNLNYFSGLLGSV